MGIYLTGPDVYNLHSYYVYILCMYTFIAQNKLWDTFRKVGFSPLKDIMREYYFQYEHKHMSNKRSAEPLTCLKTKDG